MTDNLSILLRLLRENWRIAGLHSINRAWKLTRFAGEITFVRIPDSWTLPR